jgi:hypothetical protein
MTIAFTRAAQRSGAGWEKVAEGRMRGLCQIDIHYWE